MLGFNPDCATYDLGNYFTTLILILLTYKRKLTTSQQTHVDQVKIFKKALNTHNW